MPIVRHLKYLIPTLAIQADKTDWQCNIKIIFLIKPSVYQNNYVLTKKIKNMKMKMKKKRTGIKISVLLASLVLSIALLSCDTQDKPQLQENYEVIKDNYTFFANSEKFSEADLKRGNDNYCQVETKISKVSRTANMLSIEILKPKNCEVRYEIIWNGEVQYSFPMQSAIYLRAITKDYDREKQTEIDTLAIDLEETLKNLDRSMIENLNLMVRDACSPVNIECNDDCNVVITF